MSEEGEVSPEEQQEDLRELYSFTVEYIKQGASKETVSNKLLEMGRDEKDVKIVQGMYDQIMETAEKESLTSTSVLMAAVGGILAAIVCGVIWGLVVIGTGYEIGYIAWGVGLVAGFAVVLLSGGKRGLTLQIIAVCASVIGIILGKYLTFFHYLKETLVEEHGADAVAGLSVLSIDVINFFVENIISMSHPMDLLWIVFAVGTAWRIPKGVGIKAVTIQ